MKKFIKSLSKCRCTSLLLLTLSAASMLGLSACGTQPTTSTVAACPPLPQVDSSLLAQPQGLATYSLPAPPQDLPVTAKTQVQLSDVATEHASEAAYTHWLEIMVAGWQKWYADLKKSYGPVSGPQ